MYFFESNLWCLFICKRRAHMWRSNIPSRRRYAPSHWLCYARRFGTNFYTATKQLGMSAYQYSSHSTVWLNSCDIGRWKRPYWRSIPDTPLKFNIAPKNRQSQKETHLPTVKFRGCINFQQTPTPVSQSPRHGVSSAPGSHGSWMFWDARRINDPMKLRKKPSYQRPRGWHDILR